MPCWWVGWWLWRAGCISQDTYLLYKTNYHFFLRVNVTLRVDVMITCQVHIIPYHSNYLTLNLIIPCHHVFSFPSSSNSLHLFLKCPWISKLYKFFQTFLKLSKFSIWHQTFQTALKLNISRWYKLFQFFRTGFKTIRIVPTYFKTFWTVFNCTTISKWYSGVFQNCPDTFRWWYQTFQMVSKLSGYLQMISF